MNAARPRRGGGRLRRRPGAAALLVLVALLTLAAGCGDDDGDGGGEGAGGTVAPPDEAPCPPDDPEPFDGVLALHPPGDVASGGEVTWQVTLTNQADEEAVLVYPTGQHAEVVLLGPDGDEAYRWSADRSFTQAFSCDELAARSSTTFMLTTDQLDVEPGAYVVRASSTAQDGPEPVERPLTVLPRA